MRAAMARGGGSVASSSAAETRAPRGKPAARLSLALASGVAGGRVLSANGRADFSLMVESDCASACTSAAAGNAGWTGFLPKRWQQPVAEPPAIIDSSVLEGEINLVNSAMGLLRDCWDKQKDNWSWPAALHDALKAVIDPRDTDSSDAKAARTALSKLCVPPGEYEGGSTGRLTEIFMSLHSLKNCLKSMEAAETPTNGEEFFEQHAMSQNSCASIC